MVGRGAQEAVGFSALFALSNDAVSQMASWAANDWAIFAKDPANKTVKPSDVGITAEMMNSFIVGFAIAGAECQIVTLE